MGLSNSFVSMGRIVGPVWGGVALDIYPGLPYLSGAAVMIVGFGLSVIWLIEPPGIEDEING
jgi:DHA1 family multidrug resistance protein-like MFS transporter